MEQIRCFGCMKLRPEGQPCPHCGYTDTPNEAHQLPVGTVLKEQYLIGRVLGQGGFGITYMGWDLYLDTPVAIKEYYPYGVVTRNTQLGTEVIPLSGTVGPRFQNDKDRFMREAKMLARFAQVSQIVQVKNFFSHNGTAYIIMEFVEGITLKRHVADQGGKLDLEETLQILGPVMEALGKVHKTGLVHRDISPDNIMILPGGGVKLLDFGAVRDVGTDAAADKELTRSTEAILKQGFAPIEQYQSRGSLGPWTDVYALCATICYCITGKVPTDAPERLLGDDRLQLKEQVPSLTEYQVSVLERGMALRTDDRIGSVETLHQMLMDQKTETVLGEIPRTQRPDKTSIAEKKVRQEDKARQEKKEEKAQQEKKALPGWLDWRIVALVGVLVALVAAVGIFIAIGSGKDAPGATLEDQSDQSTASPQEQTQPKQVLTGDCGDDLRWSLDLDTGVMTISGTGKMWNFSETEDGQQRPWQDHISQIRSVELGAGVTNVGPGAFKDCTALVEVDLGTDLEQIGGNAFAGTALTAVTLPNSLRVIYASAFAGCAALKEVDFGDGVEKIYSKAFYGCGLELVELPESLTKLEFWTFGDCQQLHTVLLPESLPELEIITFDNCSALRTVKIGKDTKIGSMLSEGVVVTPFNHDQRPQMPEDLMIVGPAGAKAEDFAEDIPFGTIETDDGGTVSGSVDGGVDWTLFTASGDMLLTGKCGQDVSWSLDRSDGAMVIRGTGPMWEFHYPAFEGFEAYEGECQRPWDAFAHEIHTVVVAEGVTNVGVGAFMNCAQLEQVQLAGSVQNINGKAFYGTALSAITLPEGVEGIYSHAFAGCASLKTVEFPSSLRLISTHGFQGSGIEELRFPEGIVEIAGSAFQNCVQLRQVYLPASLETMGTWTFAECASLEQVVIPEDCKLQVIPETAFYNTALRQIQLPKGIVEIGDHAFRGSQLSQIDLPASLETLGLWTFAECASLEQVVFQEGCKLQTIPGGTFNSTALRQIRSKRLSVRVVS